MRWSRPCGMALVLCLCTAVRDARAEDYWTFNYKDFEVTTIGGSAYAVELAHHIARFDKALSGILQLPAAYLPTKIYSLPGAQVKELLGDSDAVSYRFTGYEVMIVTNPRADANRYWGALFGYTGSLLVSGRASRYPYWFQLGVPALFAHTEFENDRITTGGTGHEFGRAVQGRSPIPMQTFLRLRAGDPQLKVAAFENLYQAQSLYLARQVYVEGKFKPEFSRYLGLIRDGTAEPNAFTASFKISYEDLDKFIIQSMQDSVHMFVVRIPQEPADHDLPRKLTAAQKDACLAGLSLQWNHWADALRQASEALESEPKNEGALRVLARANVQEFNFAAALAAVDRLDALAAPTAAALTDNGYVLSQLARALSEKQASVGVGAETLIRRAKEAYDRAIALDPEDLRSWAGLANIYGYQRDRAAAMEFVPRAAAMMEKHRDSAALARALATMCSQTGLTDAALRFADYWRSDALNQADLEEAVAFISQLKPHPPASNGT